VSNATLAHPGNFVINFVCTKQSKNVARRVFVEVE